MNSVQQLIQKQKKKTEIFQIQSLENLDALESSSQNQPSEMGVSDSTIATKKEESPAKVEDYFKNGTPEFDNFDQNVKYGDSRSSFMMTRAQT